MPGFDINAAKAAGYSDAEIQQFMQQQMPAQRQTGVQPGNPYMPANSPLNGMSDLDQVLAGTGRGMVHTARSIGNLVGLVPDQTLQDEKQIDAPLLSTGAGRFGNIAGEAAVTAPLGMGTGALASKVAPVLSGPIAQGIIQGGTQGLATSDPGDRAKNTLVGALTGGTVAGTGKLVNAAIHGLSRSDAAQRLLDQGIDLTPGQMNPSGAMNQFEQASESVPGAKQLIEGSRDSAEHQWQRRVIQEGAAPGATIKPSGDQFDMLQQAYDSYKPLYDQAKGYPVKPAVMNGPQGVKLSYLFDQASKLPGTTEDAQRAAKSWLDNEMTRLPANPTSDDLLELRSNIRQAARGAKLATDAISQDKAAIFAAADQHVTRALNSQLPPQALSALQSADSQYGKYKLVENAIAASKDNIAGLTPQKLSQAVYNATPDPSYARGAGGSLRQLAQDGAQVFQNVSPPTGARVLTLGAGGALAATHPYIAIPAATGALGMTASQTGRRLAQGATAPQQATQRLMEALSSHIPAPVQNVGQQLLTRGAVGAGMPVVQQYAPAALAAALLMKPKSAEVQR